MLRKRSQWPKTTYAIISFIWNLQDRKIYLQKANQWLFMTGRLAIRGLEGWQLKEYEVTFWGNENAQILLWWWLYKSMNTLKSTGLYILNNGIVYELYLVKLFKNVWAIGYWVQLTLTNTTNNLTIHLHVYFDIYPLHFVLRDIL